MFSYRHSAIVLTVVMASPALSAAQSLCTRSVSDALPLLESMETSWDEVSDYTSHLLKTERFVDGTTITERASITFRKPNQLHLRLLQGTNAGAVLLYPKAGTDDAGDRLYEAYTNTELRLDVGLGDEHFDPVLNGFPAAAASDREPDNAR